MISPLVSKFKKISFAICLLIIAIAMLAIVEYLFWEQIRIYRAILYMGITMNPCVAIILIFLSISTIMKNSEKMQKYYFHANILCATVLAFCLFDAICHLLDLSIYPDRVLFRDYLYWPGIGWSHISGTALVCFSFFALAILFLDFELKDGYRPFQFLIFFNIFIILVQLYSWVYKITKILIILKFALNTSLAVFMLCFAILFVRPDKGTTSEIVGTFSIENTILRILAMIVPLFLGWLKFWGVEAGYYSNELSNAYLAIASFLISVALLSRNAVLQEKSRKAKIAASEKIRENEERLKLVLANITEGAGVANVKGKFIFSNRVSKNLFGNEAWFIPKKSDKRPYHYYYLDGVTKIKPSKLPIFRAIIGETVENVEMMIKNEEYPEGISLRVKALPLKNKEGKIEEGVTIFRDISYRSSVEHLLKSEQKRLDAILMSLNEGVVIIDVNEKLSSFNPKAEEIFGKDLDANISKDEWPQYYGIHNLNKNLLSPEGLPFFHKYESKGTIYIRNDKVKTFLEIKYHTILARDNYDKIIGIVTLLSKVS